jgi:hypothetical protein
MKFELLNLFPELGWDVGSFSFQMERYAHQSSGIGSYPRVSCFGLKVAGARAA